MRYLITPEDEPKFDLFKEYIYLEGKSKYLNFGDIITTMNVSDFQDYVESEGIVDIKPEEILKSTQSPSINHSHSWVFPLGGQFLLDPNEVNGWGFIGPYDNQNTQDLGNVGSANLSRLAGGLVYPYDVKIKRFFVEHYNSTAAGEAWGWVIASQEKTPNSNVVVTSFHLDESFKREGVENGAGLRDYSNTINQRTDLTFLDDLIIPANHTIVLGVGAPTALNANNYVRIVSGYFELEKA